LKPANKYRWIGYLIICLYYGWFIIATPSGRPVEFLSRYVNGWLATAIWASWLVLAPIGFGPLDIPERLRTSFQVLLLISCMLLPVAIRFFPLATVLIVGLLFMELVLLIPWWKRKWQRVNGP
jgi:hypothetical protein